MHHFGRTDGLCYGYKGFEIVQLLCGQCFGDCYKQQTYVTAIAIFQDYLSSNILNRKGSIISFSVQIIAIFCTMNRQLSEIEINHRIVIFGT